MKTQQNRNDEKHEKLKSAFYDYIGENHIDNICAEIEEFNEEINRIKVPVTLDKRVYQYIDGISGKKYRKKPWINLNRTYSRVAVILLVLFSSLMTLSFGGDVLQYSIQNLLFSDHNQYSSVRTRQDESTKSVNIGWENYYYPSYLPDGFYVESVSELITIREIRFRNEKGDYIYFTQAPHNVDISLDTEGGEKKEVMINNRKAIFTVKEGKNILVWSNEEFSFYLTSNMDEKKLKYVAESLEKK